VVILDDDVSADGAAFLVMELLEGVTVEYLWKALEAPLPPEAVIGVAHQVLDVLVAAHAKSIVHRDIKPANVFVQRDGAVKVLDFGIARMMDATAATATATGALLGTPAFMAPEQAAGEKVDGRTDVWAVAATMFTLLSGAFVREAESAQQVVIMAATKPPRSLASVAAHLPRVLVDIVDRGLSFEGCDRWTAAEMRAELSLAHEELFGRPVDRAPLAALVAAVEKREVCARVEARDEPAPRAPSQAEDVEATPWQPMAGTTAQSVSREAVRAPSAPRSRPALLALGAAAAAGLAGTFAMRTKPPPPASDSVHSAVATLASPDARLACPIFQTRGVTEVGVRIGAAAAMLACAREAWEIGGGDDRVLPPAALLDVPTQPTDDYPNPYDTPDQRSRTLAAAKVRAAAYVDGSVTYDRSRWMVEMTLRAPDEREITHASGSDTGFLSAVRQAAEALWRTPLSSRPVDPDVARWTALATPPLGRMEVDVSLFGATEGCASIDRTDAGAFGASYLAGLCTTFGADAPAYSGPLPIDESSAESLVASLRLRGAWPDAPKLEVTEVRRLATKLEGLAHDAGSLMGRTRLALAAGVLWSQVNDVDRARMNLLLALRGDPLLYEAWELVVRPEGGAIATSAASVASAWFPAEATFLSKADSWRADELDARLKESRLAFVLDPRLSQALHLGRALAEAGRAEDARAIAATSLDSPEASRRLDAYVRAFIDFHDAKLDRAIEELFDASGLGMVDLLVASEVAGRTSEVAARWADWFLGLPDARAGGLARGYHAPMLFCMHLAKPRAERCLDRVERLGKAGHNWWYEGGTAMLAGARRYAAGDVRGAVDAWRPLVAGSNVEIVRGLPTAAFERAGEMDLAARLDARKLAFAFIAGVSDAAPREAERSLARGDRQRARDLAASVVRAWEVADVAVPDVARMRALLASL
jgi:serine/threonine-protein kinase